MRVLSYEAFDWDVFENLSDYMKEKIKSSDEYRKLVEPQAVHTEAQSDEELTDLPF
jgi:hypothetical protein